MPTLVKPPIPIAIDAFLANPTEDNLRAAHAAWIAARFS
jgi:uncharacterized iron-regulated protein